MKNKVLFTLLISIATLSSWAQSIPNFSFETWAIDTNYLDLTLPNPPLLDTSISANPVSWTTSNEVTNSTTFHEKSLVTQSATFYVGSSAIQLKSDSLSAMINNITGLGSVSLSFVCPGFAVCGKFPINLSSFVSLGTQFNPALLPGAGIPVSNRYSKIGGYMKNSPVGGDSAYVVAILRQGTTVVATATYTRSTTDAAYTYFEAPFVYQNCLLPDTMVYTLSSGNPYSISGVAFGNPSGLHVGSTVLIDSIFLGDSIVYGIAYPANDSAHTNINTPVSIAITANDSSCDGGPYTLLPGVLPAHGSVTLSGGDTVIYTPSAGFSGVDSFTYVESIGTGPSATAKVLIKVSGYAAGINETAEAKTYISPNPASTKLHVVTSNTAISNLRIFSILGSLMATESFSAETTVDVSTFTNGLYIIQFGSNDGKMISSTRFTVLK